MTECILLVTQRITKYPVLVERMLSNTEGPRPSVPSPLLEIIWPHSGMFSKAGFCLQLERKSTRI